VKASNVSGTQLFNSMGHCWHLEDTTDDLTTACLTGTEDATKVYVLKVVISSCKDTHASFNFRSCIG